MDELNCPKIYFKIFMAKYLMGRWPLAVLQCDLWGNEVWLNVSFRCVIIMFLLVR